MALHTLRYCMAELDALLSHGHILSCSEVTLHKELLLQLHVAPPTHSCVEDGELRAVFPTYTLT